MERAGIVEMGENSRAGVVILSREALAFRMAGAIYESVQDDPTIDPSAHFGGRGLVGLIQAVASLADHALMVITCGAASIQSLASLGRGQIDATDGELNTDVEDVAVAIMLKGMRAFNPLTQEVEQLPEDYPLDALGESANYVRAMAAAAIKYVQERFDARTPVTSIEHARDKMREWAMPTTMVQ